MLSSLFFIKIIFDHRPVYNNIMFYYVRQLHVEI